MAVTIAEMMREVTREIALRESCYPRWVADGRVSQQVADKRLEVMRAVLVVLESGQLQQERQGNLFGE